MEIFDYLRSKRRQLSLLVLLPFLAGAVAFYLLAAEPVRYRSRVEVGIPTAVASGSSAIGLYIANFRQAVSSSDVTDEIVAETGVEADELEQGLDIQQVGQANRMAVEFTGTDPDLVDEVAGTTTRAGLAALASGRVDYEQRKLAVVEEQYTQARAELDQFRTDTGLLFPDDEYRTAVEDVRDLERELAEAEGAGFQVTAETLRLRLEAARLLQETIARQYLEYQPLAETLENWSSARRDANEKLLEAETQLALVTAPDLVDGGESEPVPHTQTLLSGVALAAGVAFLLALGLLALPDLLRRPETPAGGARRAEQDDEGWLGVYVEDDALAEAGSRRRRQGS